MKSYYIIILLCVPLVFSAQITFETDYPGLDFGDWVNGAKDIAIDMDNNYYVAIGNLSPFYGESGGIIKLNEDGEIINEIEINDPLYNIRMGSGVYFFDDVLITVVNYVDVDNVTGFWKFFKYDLDFNLLDSLIMPYGDGYLLSQPKSVVQKDDELIIMASFRDTLNDFNNGLFLMEIDFNLENANFNYATSSWYAFIHDITEKADGGFAIASRGNLFNVIGEDNESFNLDIGLINENLEPDSTLPIAGHYYLKDYDIEYNVNGFYYVSGATRGPWNGGNHERDLEILKIDENFIAVDSIQFNTIFTGENETDTVDYTCGSCLEFNEDNELFYASTKNWETYQQIESWIRLVKMDEDFNIYWERYIGGEISMRVDGMKTTSDGGCIFTCTTNYFNNPSGVNLDMDLRIIKVDEDGFITGINESVLEVKSAMIYPNPSIGNINIQTLHKDYGFVIYDALGKMVFNRQNLYDNQSFDLSTLNNGLYSYSLFDENNSFIESGKIVLSK